MTPLPVKKEPLPTSDKINLVSRVWLLRVATGWCVKLNHERTVRKDRYCEIARRWWSFGQRIGQSNMDDSRRRFHARGGPNTRPERRGARDAGMQTVVSRH